VLIDKACAFDIAHKIVKVIPGMSAALSMPSLFDTKEDKKEQAEE